MTTVFLLALLILLLCISLLRGVYGSAWLVRPFSLLVCAGFVYHGVSEVLIRLSGAEGLAWYRASQTEIDRGALIAAVGLLTMTLTYVIVSKPRSLVEGGGLEEIRHQFDWRWMAVPGVILLAFTFAGKGYASGTPLGGQGLTTQGFATQFLVPVVALASFGFIVRYPTRFVIIAGIQSILLALAGQRLEVLVAGVALWLLSKRVGLHLSRRQIATMVLLSAVLLVGISSVRASVGRDIFYSNSGGLARVQALWGGLTNPEIQSVAGGGVVAETALRLDSNTWSGAIANSFDSGSSAVGLRPLEMTLLTSVPSFVFKDKVTRLDRLDRNAELAQIEHLGLARIDYLPGHVTYFLGALGVQGNLLFSALLGAVLGVLDKAALRSLEPLRVLAWMLLAQAALMFERGPTYYLLQLRAYIVLGVLVYATLLAKRYAPRWNRRRPDTPRGIAPSSLHTQEGNRPASTASLR